MIGLSFGVVIDFVRRNKWLVALILLTALVYLCADAVVRVVALRSPTVRTIVVNRTVEHRNTVTKEVKEIKADGSQVIHTVTEDRGVVDSQGKTDNAITPPAVATAGSTWNAMVEYLPLEQGVRVGAGVNVLWISVGLSMPVLPLGLQPGVYAAIRF